MKCPQCGIDNLKVIDCNRNKKLEYLSRRRKCLHCGFRFNTREYVIPDSMSSKEASLYITKKMSRSGVC